MQESSVLELVLFTTKPGREARVAELREQVREALRDFEGIIGLRGLAAVEGAPVYADLVEWTSHEQALAAARAFSERDLRFQPYLREIQEVIFMGHFSPA
ncbi:hypothetical protein [Metapseudomonas otitidis]|uniref:hypothetical protein n=1 Tax=Metapseudomonas otitidis TaxID=319939 RepID=UPI0013F6322B|nr:hypothetical protein [Pseudomonas otitidis]